MNVNLMLYEIIGTGILAAVVVLGAFTAGRIHRFTTARLLARYGLLAAMVMILLLMLLKQNTLVLFRYSASMGLYYRDRWLLLAVASAVLCSLFPKKLMFVLMPLTALMAVQKPLFWFLSDFFYRNHFVNTEMLFVLLFYIALMFLAGMGLAFTRSSVPGGKIEDGMDDETDEQSCPAGKLMLLSEPFAGQQIPLPAGEELCLGNDPADCQLVLELPGEPRCLCRVSWLDGRNCYSVMACEHSSLLYEDGTPVPVNESVTAEPGTVFLDGQTGQAVFQLGS